MHDNIESALHAMRTAEADVLGDMGPDALAEGMYDLVVTIAEDSTLEVGNQLLRRYGYPPRPRGSDATRCCVDNATKALPLVQGANPRRRARRTDRSNLLCSHDILRSQCAECAVASGAYTWNDAGEMIRVTL